MSREIARFLQTCEDNQALMADIFVAIPVRPSDGMSLSLSRMCSLWFSQGINWQPLEDHMGGFIEITRAQIARMFQKERSEKYLLMIDNDTEPPMDLPWILARHDQPVVGAVIASMGSNLRPMLCFTRSDSRGITRFMDIADGERIPATGLIEVPHVGTGALLIRRDVLDSFTWNPGNPCEHCGKSEWDIPFFIPEQVRAKGAATGTILEGEDVTFCKQVRAKGFKVHVDMEAHCGHRKTMRMIFDTSLRDPSMDAKAWFASEKGMAMKV